MRIPEDLLKMVIEQLDPFDGVKTTQALSSLSRSCKLLHDLAQRQLYSVVRIDDMRCKMDHAMIEFSRMMQAEPGANDPSNYPQWMRTMFREKEYKTALDKWNEQQRLKEEMGEELQEGDREFVEPEIFDEGDEEEDEQDYYGDYSDLPRLNYLDWAPTDILDPFSFRQLQVLEAHPHLAKLVKKLDFNGRVEGKPSCIIIDRFLAVCSNIETITLRRGQVRYLPWEWVRVIEPIVSKLPQLKRLEIINFDDGGCVELFEGIAKLNNLEHLSLTCTPRYPMTIGTDEFTLESLTTRSLTSFHLGSMASKRFFRQIPDHLLNSITSLGVAVRRQIPDLSNFENLRHFTLTFGYVSQAIQALRNLPTVNEITSLELRYSGIIAESEWRERRMERSYSEGEEEEMDSDDDGEGEGRRRKKKELDSLVDLFDYLPPKLESLSLPYDLSDPQRQEFRQAIETKLLPSIKKISLLDSTAEQQNEEMYGFDEEDSDDDGVGGDGLEGKERRLWVDDMSDLLETKGVELFQVKGWDRELEDRSAVLGRRGG
ncbi:hypothetical protein JCM5350_003285 [Sporobolomyces pararoseus]